MPWTSTEAKLYLCKKQLAFYPRDPARKMSREVNQQSRDVSMASSVVPVVCSLCGYFSPTLPLQISHLRLVHSKDPSFATVCPVYGCEENFYTFSGLNTHLYRHHRDALGLEVEPLSPPPHPSPKSATFEENDEVIDLHSDIQVGTDSYLGDPYLKTLQLEPVAAEFDQQKWSAEFLLKLSEGQRLSQVAVQDVMDGCRTLCTRTSTYVTDIIKQKLHEAGINSDAIDGLDPVILDPFEGLGSAYLQEKFYADHFPFVVSTL